jgi:hypothetical protein
MAFLLACGAVGLGILDWTFGRGDRVRSGSACRWGGKGEFDLDGVVGGGRLYDLGRRSRSDGSIVGFCHYCLSADCRVDKGDLLYYLYYIYAC